MSPSADSRRPPAGPSPRATRREWIGLAVIALPCMLYAMDLTVLNLALPTIGTELRPSASQLLWIVDIYGFMVAGLLITMGTLGDRIGRRRLLLIGAAAFGAASVLAAYSDSSTMLIASRALLGIAGATVAPSTLSLIRNMFADERQRQFAVGGWIASYSAGRAIGPMVGGVLLQYYGWGSVFLIAVPVMLLLLAVGPWLLPEYRDPQAGRIDPASVLLSLTAVLSITYGFKRIAEQGPHGIALAALAAGLTLGVVFIRRQARIDYPLIDLKLFRIPIFTAAICAYGLSCLAMFGVYIFITQYLQLVLGLSPLHAGLATMPWSVAFIAGSMVTPWLAGRLPRATVIIGGLWVGAAGFVVLGFVAPDSGLTALIVGTVVMSLGMAPVFTLGNAIIIDAAPPERTGAASAISETSSEFSGALGIAVFGSLGTALYRGLLGAELPAGLPEGSAQQAATTLAAALEVSRQLPAELRQPVARAAREAFVDSFRLAVAVGAVAMVAAALVAARVLRGEAAALRNAPQR